MTELAPTLGWHILEWQEDNLVHGPGPLLGQPYRPHDELRALTLRAYEINPKTTRRVFRRVHLETVKGWAKSEGAGGISAAELRGPVRFDHWEDGEPVGRPVWDPLIFAGAVSQDQADNTYAAARWMLESGPLGPSGAGVIDGGIEVTRCKDLPGEMKRLTTKSITKEGRSPTFVVRDETGLMVDPEHKAFGRTLARALTKRAMRDDTWMLDTTNPGVPGQGSVAEVARQPAKGKLVVVRAAGAHHDLTTPEGRAAAIIDARGCATWIDPERLEEDYQDPETDRDEWIRFHIGWWVADELLYLQPIEWQAIHRPELKLAPGDEIAIGFDGSEGTYGGDGTALVACRLSDGLVEPLGYWQDIAHPHDIAGRRRFRAAVSARVAAAFKVYRVALMYGDPPYWTDELGSWSRTYTADGRTLVREWETKVAKRQAEAVAMATQQIRDGRILHNGHPRLTTHVGNARRWKTSHGDVIGKERKGSPNKVDLAVAKVVAIQARHDALAARAAAKPNDYAQYFGR